MNIILDSCVFCKNLREKKMLCNSQNVTVNVLPLKINAKGNQRKEREQKKQLSISTHLFLVFFLLISFFDRYK